MAEKEVKCVRCGASTKDTTIITITGKSPGKPLRVAPALCDKCFRLACRMGAQGIVPKKPVRDYAEHDPEREWKRG